MNLKYITKILAVVSIIGLSFGQLMADRFTTDASVLPAPARELVAKLYPKANIAGIEVDKSILKGNEYDVMLSDGTKIEFNAKGEWKEIKSKVTGVPASILPEAIATYLNTNFKDMKIKSVSKERRGWEIELASGLELDFNKKGDLIKIDD